MYFELQLSADVFARIVRNRLKALPICLDREFVDKAGKISQIPGSLVVVDRIEIGELTSVQREVVPLAGPGLPTMVPSATQTFWMFSTKNYTSFTVPFLQVKQEVRIHLVKAGDLDTNGPNPSNPVRTLPVYPVFNVALTAAKQSQGGGPLMLSYALAYIDYGLLYLFLSDAERKDIEQYVLGLQLPPTTLDLGAVASMLDRPVTGINAGITCGFDASFVALRVDFDVYDSPPAVAPEFFRDAVENLLGGREWVMLVDREALLVDARTKSKSALENAPKVKLRSGPNVHWDPGGPAVDIDADVELVDACPFFVDDIDMDVAVDIRLSLSVPTPNVVRAHYHLHGSPSDIGEEIACAVTGALLWPFLGPLFLKDEDLGTGLGAYFGGLAAGPALTMFGILGAIETKTLSNDIADKLGDSCKKIDDENYECNETISAILQLSPPFNSRLEIEQVAGNARGLMFSGRVSNLLDLRMGGLEPIHVCPFQWQVVGRCTGNGRGNFRVANQANIYVFGTPPAALCTARIIDDPLQEFQLHIDSSTITIVPQFKPSYAANPYPCRVRVITNRGVRTITLVPPAAKTAAEVEELEKERMRALMECFFWEKRFTPVEKIKWLPDPPFATDRYAQFWQIVVRGLRDENTIRVETQRGRHVMTARPTRTGVAHLTMLFTHQQAQQELVLTLEGDIDDAEGKRELTLQQVLFEHHASIPFSGPLRGMHFEGGWHHRRLVLADEERDIVWDVSTPRAPALLSSLARVTKPQRPRATTREHEANQRPDGEQIVIHTGKRIRLGVNGNLLKALSEIEESHGIPEVVGSPRVGGIEETLYVRTEAGAKLYDLSDSDLGREMHLYNGPGWFEGIALGGKLLAKYDFPGKAIDIYVAAGAKDCR